MNPSAGGGGDHHGESLKAIAVSQQPSWIGLFREEIDNALQQDGIPLCTVIGYAVDSNDYLNLQLVNKDWKELVLKVEPPLMMRIKKLLSKEHILTQDEVTSVWTGVSGTLKTRHSPLYRKDNAAAGNWPYLQPHFNVTLMSFVHKACTQRTPHNHSVLLYDITKEHTTQFARKIVDEVWRTVLLEDSNLTIEKKLQKLVDAFQNWKGHSETVANLAGYLSRYYCLHHSLPTLLQVAENALTESLKTQDVGSLHRFLDQMRTDIGSIPTTQNKEQYYQLILDAKDACDYVGSKLPQQEGAFPTAWKTVCDKYNVDLLPVLMPVLETARDQREKRLAAAETEQASFAKPVVIHYGKDDDKAKVELRPNAFVITSSGFLAQLHLQPGDAIRLDVAQGTMEKVLEFCAIEEANPGPAIQLPIRSADAREVLGQYYGFVESTETNFLFELIEVANLFNLKNLSDVCCFKVSVEIRGRSADELRQMFNIQNDNG